MLILLTGILKLFSHSLLLEGGGASHAAQLAKMAQIDVLIAAVFFSGMTVILTTSLAPLINLVLYQLCGCRVTRQTLTCSGGGGHGSSRNGDITRSSNFLRGHLLFVVQGWRQRRVLSSTCSACKNLSKVCVKVDRSSCCSRRQRMRRDEQRCMSQVVSRPRLCTLRRSSNAVRQ